MGLNFNYEVLKTNYFKSPCPQYIYIYLSIPINMWLFLTQECAVTSVSRGALPCTARLQSWAPRWRQSPPWGTGPGCPSPDTCPWWPAPSCPSPCGSGRTPAPVGGQEVWVLWEDQMVWRGVEGQCLYITCASTKCYCPPFLLSSALSVHRLLKWCCNNKMWYNRFFCHFQMYS